MAIPLANSGPIEPHGREQPHGVVLMVASWDFLLQESVNHVAAPVAGIQLQLNRMNDLIAKWNRKDLISIESLSREEIEIIHELAGQFKTLLEKDPTALPSGSGTKTWTLHIGSSFSGVPTRH